MSETMELMLKGGNFYLNVNRDGRKLPLIDGNGDAVKWVNPGDPTLARVTVAMNNPDRMRDITPVTAWVVRGIDLAVGPDCTAWWMTRVEDK